MSTQLKAGDKAPDFSLSDQHGNTVSLKDFAGRKLAIYFYPKALTPGCTTQSCHLRDAAPDFSQLDVAIVGVSPDTPDKQKKFDDKHGLGFALLADQEKSMAQAYGVWGEKSLYGKKYMGIIRSAFLVDETGTLLAALYKISPKDTVPKLRKAAQAS